MSTSAPTQHCDECGTGPFFYVAARDYPTLCIDHAEIKDRAANGWTPENSTD